MTSTYLFRDYDHLKETFTSDVGQDLIKMARDQLGIEVIRTVYFGARQVNLEPGKKITTPADLAGIKLCRSRREKKDGNSFGSRRAA